MPRTARDLAGRQSFYLLSVDLRAVDLAEGSPVRKIALTEKSALLVDGKFVSGEVSGLFKPEQAFKFAGTAE